MNLDPDLVLRIIRSGLKLIVFYNVFLFKNILN